MDDQVTLSGGSFLAGLQHALAAVGGIIAAPLIIAMGMGLSAADTRYIIGASLMVSGLATILQIIKIGPFGSGLLSIQGTSFAFVGPLIVVFHNLSATEPLGTVLGIIFGLVAFFLFGDLVVILSRCVGLTFRHFLGGVFVLLWQFKLNEGI